VWSSVGVLTILPAVVVATMRSPRSRRAVVVLLIAVVVVSCHDAVEYRQVPLDTRAFMLATRHQHAEHLPGNDKRGWRKNRMRVWGKRTAIGDDDDDDDAFKRSWHENTVRVWGKRQGATTADRRAWAGNTIRVWGKRLADLTPEQALNVAAARYGAAPKRSIGSSDARISKLNDGGQRTPTRLSAESDVDVGTLADLMTTRSKRGVGYHHGGRWIVRRAVSHRPRWVAFRGPKRSWRTNVIRIWGKRAT